jgi:hypothetical protein
MKKIKIKKKLKIEIKIKMNRKYIETLQINYFLNKVIIVIKNIIELSLFKFHRL